MSNYQHGYPVRCRDGVWIMLDLDVGCLSLGATTHERVKHYRAWVRGAIPDREWERIREAIQRGQLTGNDRFVEQVRRKLGRRIERRGRGRPRKK